MAEIYTFSEGDLTVSGPEEELLELAGWIDGTTESTEWCNKWSDLAYSIRLQLDVAFSEEVSQ